MATYTTPNLGTFDITVPPDPYAEQDPGPLEGAVFDAWMAKKAAGEYIPPPGTEEIILDPAVVDQEQANYSADVREPTAGVPRLEPGTPEYVAAVQGVRDSFGKKYTETPEQAEAWAAEKAAVPPAPVLGEEREVTPGLGMAGAMIDAAVAQNTVTDDPFLSSNEPGADQARLQKQGMLNQREAELKSDLVRIDADELARNDRTEKKNIAFQDELRKRWKPQLEDDVKKIENGAVKHNRVWANMDFGTGLFTLLTAFAGGLFSKSTGGKNLVLESINDYIQRDIAQQEGELQLSKEAYELHKGQMSEELDDASLAKMRELEGSARRRASAINQVKQLEAGLGEGQAKLDLHELGAKLERDKAANIAEAQALAERRRLENAKLEAQTNAANGKAMRDAAKAGHRYPGGPSGSSGSSGSSGGGPRDHKGKLLTAIDPKDGKTRKLLPGESRDELGYVRSVSDTAAMKQSVKARFPQELGPYSDTTGGPNAPAYWTPYSSEEIAQKIVENPGTNVFDYVGIGGNRGQVTNAQAAIEAIPDLVDSGERVLDILAELEDVNLSSDFKNSDVGRRWKQAMDQFVLDARQMDKSLGAMDSGVKEIMGGVLTGDKDIVNELIDSGSKETMVKAVQGYYEHLQIGLESQLKNTLRYPGKVTDVFKLSPTIVRGRKKNAEELAQEAEARRLEGEVSDLKTGQTPKTLQEGAKNRAARFHTTIDGMGRNKFLDPTDTTKAISGDLTLIAGNMTKSGLRTHLEQQGVPEQVAVGTPGVKDAQSFTAGEFDNVVVKLTEQLDEYSKDIQDAHRKSPDFLKGVDKRDWPSSIAQKFLGKFKAGALRTPEAKVAYARLQRLVKEGR